MKKILAVILSVTLIMAFAACSSGTETQQETGGTESQQTQAAAEGDGKTLVAYFSWSGNTKELAEMIQQETGGDIFEIQPETAYTEDYDELLDIAQQEQNENARPSLAAQVENWDQYDTIFVGYPNWWNDAPMVILSFLESYDFEGKKLVPFCTSGGSGFGTSLSTIEGSAEGAEILEGYEVGGSSVSGAADEVAEWIQGLSL